MCLCRRAAWLRRSYWMSKTWSLGGAERMVFSRPRALGEATEPWRTQAQKGLLYPHTPLTPLSPCLLGSPQVLEHTLVLFWPVPLHLSLSWFFAQPVSFPPPLSAWTLSPLRGLPDSVLQRTSPVTLCLKHFVVVGPYLGSLFRVSLYFLSLPFRR